MNFPYIEKYKDKSIIIWGHPQGSHTHSWIHYRFFRTFTYLGFDVQWLDNKIENLPDKNKEYIIITSNLQDSILLQNPSKNRIIFDHYLDEQSYIQNKSYFANLIPFGVVRYNLANNTKPNIFNLLEGGLICDPIDKFYFETRCPKILRGSELLPHEIERKPYHYSDSRDVSFVGSWRHNNAFQLESLRLYCLTHGLDYHQYGKHLLLRGELLGSKFLSPQELELKTREAYIAPAIQGVQVDDGYIPCRLFIHISLSVLGVSNNPYVYNLFDDDEVIVDRDIRKMMDKAQKVIRDREVDIYTRKAIQKVKEQHTYINRIDQLFSYL